MRIKQTLPHIFKNATVLFNSFQNRKAKTTQTCFLSFVFKTQNQFFQFKKQCEKNCYSNKFFGFFIFKNQKQFLKTLVKQARDVFDTMRNFWLLMKHLINILIVNNRIIKYYFIINYKYHLYDAPEIPKNFSLTYHLRVTHYSKN